MSGWLHSVVFSKFRLFVCIVWTVFLSTTGCVSIADAPQLTHEPAYIPVTPLLDTPTPTLTLVPIPLAILPPPVPTLQEYPPVQICSPLEGIFTNELESHISNPFHPPPPGSDDPHQGVDLADIGPDGVAREGLQVNTVLPGRVAAVIRDRFPYGNALLVETRFENLPPAWLSFLQWTGSAAAPQIHSALTCPALSLEPEWNRESASLYLLYAHLQASPEFETGEEVDCSQKVGAIGSSGNALNPHLHLEARTGPSGARFASLAHYDVSASTDEMAAYCIWRVSGLFQLVDPMSLFSFP